MTFNLNKKLVTGHCSASRCKATDDLTDMLMAGREVELCPRHKTIHDQSQMHPKASAADSTAPPEAPHTVVSVAPGEVRPLAVIIPADVVRPEAQDAYTEAAEQLEQLRALEITGEPQSVAAQEFLAGVKGSLKGLEAKRQAAVKPLGDVLRVVNSWFKPGTDTLKELEQLLKGALNRYWQAQEASKHALLATGQHEQALALPDPVISGNIQRRSNWTYKIINPGMVPADYWVLDEKKIATQVKAEQGGCIIPGVQVYDAGTIAVKV